MPHAPESPPWPVGPVSRSSSCSWSSPTSESSFHTDWSNGGVYHAGLTTAWTPNKQTLYYCDGSVPVEPAIGTGDIDTDIISVNENDGNPTFAAFTARSYHPGGVNVLVGDGSVRFAKSTIDGMGWRPWEPSPAERLSRPTLIELFPQGQRSKRSGARAGHGSAFCTKCAQFLSFSHLIPQFYRSVFVSCHVSQV